MDLTDVKLIGDLVSDALEDSKTRQEIQQIVIDEFEKQKSQMIQALLADEISQEIMNPDKGNISGTLGGYGDLFGFIGFFEGSDPIGGIVDVFRSQTKLKNIDILRIYNRDARGRFTSGKQTRNVKITFSVPDLNDFDTTSAEVLRDEVSRNWVKGVEKGLSGFNRYANYMGKGQSGRGIQVRGPIKNPRESANRPTISSFRPRSYVTPLIRGFIKTISGL
jgi:hypothetical protein